MISTTGEIQIIERGMGMARVGEKGYGYGELSGSGLGKHSSLRLTRRANGRKAER